MQGVFGGLVIVILYGTYDTAEEEEFALKTQDNVFILTENSEFILVQE